MKSDKINFNDLENSIKKIEELSDSIRMSLQGADNIIKDNIATNIGIWDGASATAYTNQWESLSEKIPSYITTFEEQAISLSEYSKKMKSTEN